VLQGGAGALGGYDPFDLGDEADLSDFELLDEFPTLGPVATSVKPAAPAAAGGGEAVASNDMFHFFRAVNADHSEAEVEQLPALLHAAESPTHFDQLAQSAARAAPRLVRSDQHEQAVALRDALGREAERPDRTRIFRDAAVQALRRVGAAETLQHLSDLLHHGGQERERILRFFEFLGGEAVAVLEATLFRTGDAELRAAVFRHVVRMEGASQRVMARAMADPSPTRTRALLELVSLPEVDHDLALRWIAEAAAHPDGAVRIDAARHASTAGGRGGLRVLLDLLNNDRDPLVRRATIQALGTLNDTAAVPFLARVVSDGAEEETLLAAISALGRLGAAEALPALLAVVNKRALFAGKTLTRPRAAALAAIARLQGPGPREVMRSLAGGKDAPVAAEAQRLLGMMD
jgi:HEAT repeat protein